jgi:hypothetical protein
MSSPTTTVLYTYKGDLTFNTIEGILNDYRKFINQHSVELVVLKRVYSVLVECLENTYRHAVQNTGNFNTTYVDLALTETDEDFVISIANRILNTNVQELITRINLVNSLDHTGVNRLYRASISKANISEKGGAGLGIIEIARNSRQKIYYDLIAENATTSTIRFEIKVSKKPNNVV